MGRYLSFKFLEIPQTSPDPPVVSGTVSASAQCRRKTIHTLTAVFHLFTFFYLNLQFYITLTVMAKIISQIHKDHQCVEW